MINSYYLMQNGQQVGPFSHHELMDMELQPDTLVLSPLAADWQDAGDLPEFAEYFESKGIYAGHSTYAGFGWRLLAYIIDTIIVQIALGLISLVSETLVSYLSNYSEWGGQYVKYSSLLVTLVIYLFYNSFLESTEMQGSIGKKICNIIVVDSYGRRLTFLNALGRNAAKIFSGMICAVGYFMVIWDDKGQGLHDKMAKTYVMRTK